MLWRKNSNLLLPELHLALLEPYLLSASNAFNGLTTAITKKRISKIHFYHSIYHGKYHFIFGIFSSFIHQIPAKTEFVIRRVFLKQRSNRLDEASSLSTSDVSDLQMMTNTKKHLYP